MKRITFLLISIICFINCSKNNESQEELDVSFTGVWHLVRIDGGFSASINYEKEQITWTINSDKKTITIKNTVDNYVGVLAIFANNHSGTYSYTIEKENNFEYLIVEGKKGVMNYTNEGLEIDYGLAVDDVRYTFKR